MCYSCQALDKKDPEVKQGFFHLIFATGLRVTESTGYSSGQFTVWVAVSSQLPQQFLGQCVGACCCRGRKPVPDWPSPPTSHIGHPLIAFGGLQGQAVGLVPEPLVSGRSCFLGILFFNSAKVHFIYFV